MDQEDENEKSEGILRKSGIHIFRNCTGEPLLKPH